MSVPFTLDADPNLAIFSSCPVDSSAWHMNNMNQYDDRNVNSSSDLNSIYSDGVILQPSRLANSNFPAVVDVLPESPIRVRGHPLDTYASIDLDFEIDAGGHVNNDNNETMSQSANPDFNRYTELTTRRTGSKRKPPKVARSQSCSEVDSSCNRQSSTKSTSQSELIGSGIKLGRPSLLKSCQNARAKLVSKLPRRSSFRHTKQKPNDSDKDDRTYSTHEPVGRKIQTSLSKIKQSIADSKFSREGRKLIRIRKRQTSSELNQKQSDCQRVRPNDNNYSSVIEAHGSSYLTNEITEDQNNDMSFAMTGDSKNYKYSIHQNYPSASIGDVDNCVINSECEYDEVNLNPQANAPKQSSEPPSNDVIYSLASALPHNNSDSDSKPKSSSTKRKWPSNVLPKRPRFLKNYKFFGKS